MLILRRSGQLHRRQFPLAAVLDTTSGDNELTVADTGVGSDQIANIFVSTSVLDSGSGVDAAVAEYLTGACIGGVLTVNATNGRYFDNDAGPIVLSGFHTWQVSGAENSDSDPPAAFDFDEFLTALTTKGVNFTKLWAMETPEDWPNLSPMYFAPLPWARTGPGTAADGKPKFDLTTFDQDYFDRMRTYAVRLGNAGIYCAVQMFQGWHIAQKGYSVGSPGDYHPFNAANNINSIDGDTDNDGDLVESRDTALTSIYNLQKSYVEKVIDTLNDLDHIIWEVENEGESDLTWQRAIAAYVKSYESGKPKQHPVGLTKLYPGGSNSDLYASDVEWTSIDDDYPTPVPDEADGSMVILWDTDHVLGLTTDWRLSWMSFTRGNNPVYMDEWNGWTYGTDRRADASAEKYRANLGYILDYVAQVDIVGMTPQGSLSSTGYCIAGTTQLIAYQPGSGNFTVDLSSYSGTFTVEYLRTGTGATSTGTTVGGGAVRTMVAPWAGEDFVAFLEQMPAVSDSGAGVEAVTVAVTLGVSDTGTGADSPGGASASLATSDSGAGDDVLAQLLAAATVADVGTGTDSQSISVTITVADTGAGIDDALALILIAIADAGSAADNLDSITVAVTVLDTGAGDDALAVSVTLAVSDTGAGADDLNVITAVLISILEAGAGVDALTVSVDPLTVADVGTGDDTAGVAVTLALSDSAAGNDEVLSSVLIAIADAAAAVDAAGSITVNVPVADVGQAADTIGAISAALSVVDLGVGVDVAVRFDSAVKIVQVVFSLTRRTIGFAWTARAIEFTLNS